MEYGEQIFQRITKTAEASITPNRMVTYGTTEGTAKAASAGDDSLLGISQGETDNTTAIDADDDFDIVTDGLVKAYVSEAVDYGDDLMVTGSAGILAKAENATAEETYIAATAEETVTTAGLCLVNLKKMNQVRTV